MKIEYYKATRECVCRGEISEKLYPDGHLIEPGTEIIKISNFTVVSSRPHLILCREHAEKLLEGLKQYVSSSS